MVGSGLQQFLAFAQTARRQSFAAAARDLGMSPSAVAKGVARLEERLGVKLFHRTTRKVSLTPDGERLFQRCERVLAEVDDLEADAAGVRVGATGTLRIDIPLMYGRQYGWPGWPWPTRGCSWTSACKTASATSCEKGWTWRCAWAS